MAGIRQRKPGSRSATLAVLVASLGIVLAVILGPPAGRVATRVLGMSVAASAPPPPAITSSGPASPTKQTTATFTYTDTQNGVGFQCKLDGSAYASCPRSGVTYSSVADGAHTFSVTAQSGNGPASPAATRSWTVDTTAPVIVLSFPAVNGAYNAAAWNAGCSAAPGICGTAGDLTGFTKVEVSLRQASSGRYWNGSSFGSSAVQFNAATGTAVWRLPLPLPADGSYSVSVRATDTLGNGPRVLNAAFGVDTVAPQFAPVITQRPDDATVETSATFGFVDAEAGVGFECKLDTGSFAACSSGIRYSNLSVSEHSFSVRAVDAGGNRGPQTSLSWTILLNKTFPIGGNLDEALSPGVGRPLDLVFTNPHDFAIKVVGVTITVESATTRNGLANPGCNGTQNLVVERPFSGPVIVPANAKRSLSSLGVAPARWPLLTMPNLSTNQDACRNTTFKLTYTGTATKP
jgi:hypothetical protein